jgi:excisionase family DNA binding protein
VWVSVPAFLFPSDSRKRKTVKTELEPILVTKRAAACLLSVSVRTVDNLIAAKRLTARKIGRRTLIPRSAIEQLARRDTPSPALEAAEVRNASQ